MNICYINPTNNIRRPIAELANLLAKKGHNITILYPTSKDCPTKNWVANELIKNPKIKKISIKSWYFASLRYNIPNLFHLYKEIKKVFQDNDRIHIWEYYYPLSVIPLLHAFFSRKRREKTILTTDGFVGYSYRPKSPWWLTPAFRIYTQFFARFLFRIPKTMTTYGNSMLPYAKKAGVPLKKLKVIPTGIHLERFQNVDKKKVKQLKEEFKIKEEKIILFVGMLTERKGIDKVIEVSTRLLKEGNNIKTLIVGDAHGENKYLKLVPDKYHEKIIFTGGRTEIPEFMHLAEVLLLPSEGEGLPGAVMEAMASGLPIVATNEGCTPDLISSSQEGSLVKLNRNYLSAVKNILNNKELAQKLSQNGQEKIKIFAWEKVAQKYEQL